MWLWSLVQRSLAPLVPLDSGRLNLEMPTVTRSRSSGSPSSQLPSFLDAAHLQMLAIAGFASRSSSSSSILDDWRRLYGRFDLKHALGSATVMYMVLVTRIGGDEPAKLADFGHHRFAKGHRVVNCAALLLWLLSSAESFSFFNLPNVIQAS